MKKLVSLLSIVMLLISFSVPVFASNTVSVTTEEISAPADTQQSAMDAIEEAYAGLNMAAASIDFKKPVLMVDGKLMVVNGKESGVKVKGAVYKGKSKTLRLTGHKGSGIVSMNMSFKVDLKGNSTIKSNKSSPIIVDKGKLTFQGSGKLDVTFTAPNNKSQFTAVVASRDILFSSGTVNVRIKGGGESMGIASTTGKIIINAAKGAKVTAYTDSGRGSHCAPLWGRSIVINKNSKTVMSQGPSPAKAVKLAKGQSITLTQATRVGHKGKFRLPTNKFVSIQGKK